jgi:cytochrome c-type biogenesis protein CcmH/NrfF
MYQAFMVKEFITLAGHVGAVDAHELTQRRRVENLDQLVRCPQCLDQSAVKVDARTLAQRFIKSHGVTPRL